MRIAFVGKGGSGKTTLAAAFIHYLRTLERFRVLACDGDINQCLFSCLPEATHTIPCLADHTKSLKTYVIGANSHIQDVTQVLKTSPPARGSKLIRLSDIPSELRELIQFRGGLACLEVGSFDDSDLGSSCYHAKTGSLELLLNHVVDTSDDCIVCDMTAGSDAFASGLVAQFDLLLLIVEPTLQSTSVFRQFSQFAQTFQLRVECIANKVQDQRDLAFVQEQIGRTPLAIVKQSSSLRAFEQGEKGAFKDFVERNVSAFEAVLHSLCSIERDWERYYEQVCFFHRKNCLDWANAYLGMDLIGQIDPEFTYRLSE